LQNQLKFILQVVVITAAIDMAGFAKTGMELSTKANDTA